MRADYLDLNGHSTHVAGIIAANGKILGMRTGSQTPGSESSQPEWLLALSCSNNQGLAWVRNWVGENGQER